MKLQEGQDIEQDQGLIAPSYLSLGIIPPSTYR